jgi:hypothetical protein
MDAIHLNTIRSCNGRSEPIQHNAVGKLLQRIRSSAIDWLSEPIPFPGKWPECNPRPQGYNTDGKAWVQSTEQTDV